MLRGVGLTGQAAAIAASSRTLVLRSFLDNKQLASRIHLDPDKPFLVKSKTVKCFNGVETSRVLKRALGCSSTKA